ncbi:hypothetical protein E2P42_01590 [Candidatus Bathyarchaeota archaeon]|nr:hypothetical protein E2P42_01590 [Candidatus Bathyarchaeota archaeon]
MTAEKEKLDNLLERIDEILLMLKGISEDMHVVSASLKSMAVSQITHPAQQPQSVPNHEGYERQNSVEDIRMSFPPELESLLSIEERNEYIIIKPRQFLGSENFAKTASAVRGMGGEYISAGKDSHFRVPKRKA